MNKLKITTKNAKLHEFQDAILGKKNYFCRLDNR